MATIERPRKLGSPLAQSLGERKRSSVRQELTWLVSLFRLNDDFACLRASVRAHALSITRIVWQIFLNDTIEPRHQTDWFIGAHAGQQQQHVIVS